MDIIIKKGLFGGYKRKSVEAAVRDYESRLQDIQQACTRLESENASIRENTAKLEAANQTLKDETGLKDSELHRLESKLKDLQTLYDQSVAARREYEQYLNRVGQVYMVACDSAGGIVQRAENNAIQLLNTLSDTAEQSQLKANEAVASLTEVRNHIAMSLPGLLNTVNAAFKEIDSFLQTAQSVPQFYSKVQEIQQSAHRDIQAEIDSFHRSTQSIVNQAKKNEPAVPPLTILTTPVLNFTRADDKTPGDRAVDPAVNFAARAEGYIPAAPKEDHPVSALKTDYTAVHIPPSAAEPASISPLTNAEAAGGIKATGGVQADNARLTLLEQEKLKRKLEQEGQAEDSGAAAVNASKENASAVSSSPLPYAVGQNEPQNPAEATSGPDYTMPNSYKRHPNVKELLTKYSQIK